MILSFLVVAGIAALLVGLSARAYYFGCVIRGGEYDGIITQSECKTARGVEEAESHLADIEYEFEVAGRKIISRSLRIGIPTNTRKSVESIVHRYPVGTLVTVFYDQRSGRSILERGNTEGTWCMFALGIVFAAMAVMILVRG